MQSEENGSETKEVDKGLKNSFKDYFKLGEVGKYFFRKKDPGRPSNFNIKVMHGINKISILIFLAALIFFIIKKLI